MSPIIVTIATQLVAWLQQEVDGRPNGPAFQISCFNHNVVDVWRYGLPQVTYIVRLEPGLLQVACHSAYYSTGSWAGELADPGLLQRLQGWSLYRLRLVL